MFPLNSLPGIRSRAVVRLRFDHLALKNWNLILI